MSPLPKPPTPKPPARCGRLPPIHAKACPANAGKNKESKIKNSPHPAFPLISSHGSLVPAHLRSHLWHNSFNLRPRLPPFRWHCPSPLSSPVPNPHPITFPQYRSPAHAHRRISSRLMRLALHSSSSWNRPRRRHCPHHPQRAKAAHPLGPPSVPPPSRSRLFPRNHAHPFFSYPFPASPQHRFISSSSSSFRTPTRHDPLP